MYIFTLKRIVNPIKGGLFSVLLNPFELLSKFVTFPRYELNTFSQNLSPNDNCILNMYFLTPKFEFADMTALVKS